MFELMVEDSFSAAHQLKGYEGPCEKLHGHTFKVQVYLSGDSQDKLGMFVDFKIIRKKLKDCIEELDHSNLSEFAAFKSENPTAENLAKYIFKKLGKEIAAGPKISKVTVFESPTAAASYYE